MLNSTTNKIARNFLIGGEHPQNLHSIFSPSVTILLSSPMSQTPQDNCFRVLKPCFLNK